MTATQEAADLALSSEEEAITYLINRRLISKEEEALQTEWITFRIS